jgi:hypothetical protein
MAVQLQLRRDTAANWTATNPTLAQGEAGYETDTGYTKMGNGATAWTSLAYQVLNPAVVQTLSNKRITQRVVTVNAPGATPTTNSDNCDVAAFTGLATAITSMTTNLTGTPVAGDLLMFQFTDNGTAQTIAWGAKFEATTVALPATTVISKMLRVEFQWNVTATKWDCIRVA